jgi:cell division protein FtsL
MPISNRKSQISNFKYQIFQISDFNYFKFQISNFESHIMLKLLLTLTFALVLAAVLLGLRQQRLELNYQTNDLHDEIRASQAKLWQQQLLIAQYTAPNAISKTVGEHDLNMVPAAPLPPKEARWIDPKDDPDAE